MDGSYIIMSKKYLNNDSKTIQKIKKERSFAPLYSEFESHVER